MSVRGILLYRCRKCGRPDEVPVIDIAQGLAERIAEGSAPTTIHQCSPGHYGGADLIGGWTTEASTTPPDEPEDQP